MNTASSYLATMLLVSLGLSCPAARLLATEPLENYEGAWLFRDDRKQVWSAVEDTDAGGVILCEQYQALCGVVQKRWDVRFDDNKKQFIGTLKTVFKREESSTEVHGDWDQETSTMTWTLANDSLDAKIRHQFLNSKLIVTTLRKGDDPNRKQWHELGTLSPTAR